MNESETWADIPGYEGLYRINTSGLPLWNAAETVSISEMYQLVVEEKDLKHMDINGSTSVKKVMKFV